MWFPLVAQERSKDCVELGFNSSEKAYRIVLAGDAAVGKSSFLLRLTLNEFRGDMQTTLGEPQDPDLLLQSGTCGPGD